MTSCLKRLRRCLALHALAAGLLVAGLVAAELVIHRLGLPAICRDVTLVYFAVSSHILAERALARSKRLIARKPEQTSVN